jgi:hypothetical protein
MSPASILTEDFAQAAAAAGLKARQDALNAGYPVVFLDKLGRYIQEMPDGTCLEVYLDPNSPRESHVQILGEVPAIVQPDIR